MLKNILKLQGIQEIEKSEQTTINGSWGTLNKCSLNGACLVFDYTCYEIECRPWNAE